jgi:hypothetical protein
MGKSMTIGNMAMDIFIMQIIEDMKVSFAMANFMAQAFIMTKITK